MPEEFGRNPIVVSSAGGLRQLIVPLSRLDPVLLSTARTLVRPGSVVWDVGANTGVFSVAASALAGQTGRIFSFEPDLFLVSLLRRTARLQPDSAAEITIIPSAIANKTGIRNFLIAARARASNALEGHGNSQTGGVREVQTIISLSLDDCLNWIDTPDVVKIDVEGAELEALVGAGALLSKIRPVIACEVSPANTAAVTTILKNNSYDIFDASEFPATTSEVETATWNSIAVPTERRAQVL